MLKTLFFIAMGGSLGSILRYLLTLFTNKQTNSIFPYGTFIVNIIGCILVGFLIVLFEQYINLNQNLKNLLIIGFCGSFTTFSTFSLETYSLIQNSNYLMALTYIIFSITIGVLAIFIGFLIAKNIV